MGFGFFAKKKIVPFSGNHFRNATVEVEALQNNIEIADAKKFKNSVAALVNSKTPTPRPTLGLFAAPKPQPKLNVVEVERKNTPRL